MFAARCMMLYPAVLIYVAAATSNLSCTYVEGRDYESYNGGTAPAALIVGRISSAQALTRSFDSHAACGTQGLSAA
jgi:hypothetical protein